MLVAVSYKGDKTPSFDEPQYILVSFDRVYPELGAISCPYNFSWINILLLYSFWNNIMCKLGLLSLSEFDTSDFYIFNKYLIYSL